MATDFVERCNQNCFNPERRLCGVGISSCCMVANGNVYPCAGWQEMVLGNLKEDTLIIYLSDHGEEVYDLLDMASHSGDVESSSMYEIPVMIWGSNKFKKNHADKWENIKNSVDRPYMTDDMIHTVLDIAEIETADYDETRSLTNPRFDTSRKRIINASDEKNKNEYYHGMK